MNQRYDDRSEYGGGDGSNYIRPDGTPRSLSAGERARLLRSEGLQPDDFGVSQRPAYDPATNPDPNSAQIVPGFRQD